MTATKAEKPKRESFAKRETETPTIEFSAGKGMSYRRRLWGVMALVAVGFGVQVVWLNALLGLPFLVAALVLTWVRGFDSKLDRRGLKLDASWELVETDRIRDIYKLDRKMREWDSSLTDISSSVGAFMFLLVLAGIIGAYIALHGDWPGIAGILAVDGALLLLPQWFNGMRFIQTRGDLVLKATHVSKVLDAIGPGDTGKGELKARMHMSGPEEKRAPTNFKLVAAYPDGPEGFYGVQAQVVINRVQGTGYPYFYACIVGKEGLGVLKRAKPESLPSNVIMETETKDEVDVIIIRQRTSKTSGYHTKPPTSIAILKTALKAADRFARG